MDTPPSIHFSTQILQAPKIDFIEEVKINEEYKIHFGIIEDRNELAIKIVSEKSKNFFYFQQIYTMNELHSYSKIFCTYKNPKDVITILKKQKFEIIEKNDFSQISFKTPLPNGKNQLVELKLTKWAIETNDIIKLLFDEIKEIKENMKNEISSIKQNYESEIKGLKDNIINYQKEISNLNISISNYKNEILNTKNENKLLLDEINKLKTVSDSLGLYQKNKISFLDIRTVESLYSLNFIFDYIRQNDREFIFKNIKLLYRGSRDGDSTKICHELCDNKQNVLIIIKSDNGYIFGGYSKIGFKISEVEEYMIDNNSFLFSVNLQKIYPVIKDQKVICHLSESLGLCFDSSIIYYDYFMHQMDNLIYSLINTRFNGLENIYEMNGGKSNFLCKELEVFQLL